MPAIKAQGPVLVHCSPVRLEVGKEAGMCFRLFQLPVDTLALSWGVCSLPGWPFLPFPGPLQPGVTFLPPLGKQLVPSACAPLLQTSDLVELALPHPGQSSHRPGRLQRYSRVSQRMAGGQRRVPLPHWSLNFFLSSTSSLCSAQD